MKKRFKMLVVLLPAFFLSGCGTTDQLSQLQKILFDDPTWPTRFFAPQGLLDVLPDKAHIFMVILAIWGLIGVTSALRHDRSKYSLYLSVILAAAFVPRIPLLLTTLGKAAFTQSGLTLALMAKAGGWLTKDLDPATLLGTIDFVSNSLPNFHVYFMVLVTILVIWNLIAVCVHGNGKGFIGALIWILAYILWPNVLVIVANAFIATFPPNPVVDILTAFNLQFRILLVVFMVIDYFVVPISVLALVPDFSVPSLITAAVVADGAIQTSGGGASRQRNRGISLDALADLGLAGAVVADTAAHKSTPPTHETSETKRRRGGPRGRGPASTGPDSKGPVNNSSGPSADGAQVADTSGPSPWSDGVTTADLGRDTVTPADHESSVADVTTYVSSWDADLEALKEPTSQMDDTQLHKEPVGPRDDPTSFKPRGATNVSPDAGRTDTNVVDAQSVTISSDPADPESEEVALYG